MGALNLIYALKDDNLVHISEVESGLKCGCICPACGGSLIAKKGDIVMHHFAHQSTVECEYGYQTSLHLAAKEIISEHQEIILPALYLEFQGTGSRELIHEERIVKVSKVILEKKLDNIIPDILLETDIGKIIIEIYVTHEIDNEKERKIQKLGIQTIEIDLSKFERDITKEDLENFLIGRSENKHWVYNKEIREVYKRFVAASEKKKLVTRNYAVQVDDCPIKKRVWNGKPYANFLNDCEECDYFIDYDKVWNSKEDKEETILCSGKSRIAHIVDFDLPYEKRVQNSEEKMEEEMYELIGQGICPKCYHDLVIRQGKFGEFFGCSKFPRCKFTFRYAEDEQ